MIDLFLWFTNFKSAFAFLEYMIEWPHRYNENNADCAPPYNIPLLVFTAAKLFLLLSISLSRFPWFFKSTLWLCTFWESLLLTFEEHIVSRFVVNPRNSYIFISFCSPSLYNSSPVPVVLFRHPFSSSGNSLWLIHEWQIPSLICAVSIFHIIGRHDMGL